MAFVCADLAIAHEENCPNILIIGSLCWVNNNLFPTCGIIASLFAALFPTLSIIVLDDCVFIAASKFLALPKAITSDKFLTLLLLSTDITPVFIKWFTSANKELSLMLFTFNVLPLNLLTNLCAVLWLSTAPTL